MNKVERSALQYMWENTAYLVKCYHSCPLKIS